MNISRPNSVNPFEAFADPVSGPRGRVMTARSAPDATTPQVNTAGAVSQEATAPADLRELVDRANSMMKNMNVGIEFSFDAQDGDMVVKVVDAETRDILRQFPSEEMLAMSRAMEKMQAALVKQTA